MKIGDLVCFKPDTERAGALTAVKYYARIKKVVGEESGLIISCNGDNFLVLFGDKHVVLHEKHLEIISESQKTTLHQ